MINCLNCNTSFEGKYCNNCGQKASTHRFSLAHVLHDIPHSVLHVDKGILKNIISIKNPRQTIYSYIEGKRVGYFNPFLFFLLTIGLIFFLETLMQKDFRPEFDVVMDDFKVNATEFLHTNLKYIYFGSCFLFALPARWFFRRETHFNYAEQVVVNMFIMGYIHIIYLALIYFPFLYTYPVNLATPILLFLFQSLIFYKDKWWLTVIKTLLVVALQMVFFFLSASIASILYAIITG